MLWLEDPIRWEWGNVDALRKICQQTETPICTSEISYGAKPHRDLIEAEVCDMLEPNIPNSGGAIDIRSTAELAEMHYVHRAAQHEEHADGHRGGAYLLDDPQLPGAVVPLAQHPAVEHDADHGPPDSGWLHHGARWPGAGH